MPKAVRKKNRVVKVNIERLAERMLIDSKLRPLKDNIHWPRVVGYSAGLGLLIGGGILLYLIFSQSPAEPNFTPKIIVPETPEVISPPPQEEVSETPVVQTLQVEILDTPTGFLNVRKGPGTNFAKVAQVKPGEIYELVSEDSGKGWYQIKLDQDLSGWVTKQYAKIK